MLSKHIFTEKEAKDLSSNKCIISASKSTIKFEPDFMILIAKQNFLVDAKNIFESNNLNRKTIGDKRIEQCYYRWKEKYNKYGEGGFMGITKGRKPSLNSDM